LQREGSGHRDGGACAFYVATRFFHLPSQPYRRQDPFG
jgi:hypothetical protein